MNKKNLKYWIFILLAVLAVFLSEYFSPKEIDWTVNYIAKDKRPYGSYVVYNQLKNIFPNQEISTVRTSFYEMRDTLTVSNLNIICIDERISPDELETESLLEIVSRGNNAFLSAESFYGKLADTLHIHTKKGLNFDTTMSLNFINPLLKSTKDYVYNKGGIVSHFTRIDSSKFIILGKNDKNKPTFIKIPYGSGSFYFCSTPIAFTNYHILDKHNQEYTAKAFSYLPVNPVIWNEYYKEQLPQLKSQSPMRFILSHPPLRWAYYITLAAVFIFMIFEAKRKQRIIPIVKPLANTSLEFAETVGRLYFQYKDHKNIADKKITYFLEYIRTKYYVKTNEFNDHLIEIIAQKSGTSKESVADIFRKITFIQNQLTISEENLISLNKNIEDFYHKSS